MGTDTSTSSATSIVESAGPVAPPDPEAAPGSGGTGFTTGGPQVVGTAESGTLGVFIDDVDVSECALEGFITRRLSRPGEASVTLPMDCAIGGAGSRLKIYMNGVLMHHGFVLLCETDTGEDTGRTVYNSGDPMELWKWRPARDWLDSPTPGNFIDPFFLRLNDPLPTPGPQIMFDVLMASEEPTLIPTAAEGPLFLEWGTFDSGGADLAGAPATFPITIMDLASLLVSAGTFDIVLTPVDSGGNMARIDCLNKAGVNRTGSISFDYGQGNFNVQNLRWNEDMGNTCNKLQYFFGPKESIRRYKGNITGDDPCLDVQIGATPMANLQTARLASRAAVGVRMEIQEFEVGELAKEQDAFNNCVYLDPTRRLYRGFWYMESWARVGPRTLIHVTPAPGMEIGTFDVGDMVSVTAAPAVRGGFSGVQRVYSYTISWNEDGPFSLGEVQVSSDMELAA